MADLSCLGQMCAIGHGMEAPVLLAGLSELGAAKSREEIEAEITAELPAINARLPVHERIAQVFLVADEWTIDNELLTPTMKLKRNGIIYRYQSKAEASVPQGLVAWES